MKHASSPSRPRLTVAETRLLLALTAAVPLLQVGVVDTAIDRAAVLLLLAGFAFAAVVTR